MKVCRIALKFPAMCLTTPQSDQEGKKTRVLKWLIFGVLGVISWRVPSARQLISSGGRREVLFYLIPSWMDANPPGGRENFSPILASTVHKNTKNRVLHLVHDTDPR